jgi:hypothetical protein
MIMFCIPVPGDGRIEISCCILYNIQYDDKVAGITDILICDNDAAFGEEVDKDMIVYAMQPYFFPYVGYFSPIKQCDVFIVVDTVQYRKQSWINRNRIISLDKDFTYIHIPIHKKDRDSLIKDVLMTDDPEWGDIFIKQLSIYARKAPFYKQVIELVRTCLEYKTSYLSEWNVNSIIKTCEYLGIERKTSVLSNMPIRLETVNAPDEWGLFITLAVGGDAYLNLPGGVGFYNKDKYLERGIELKFIRNNITPYDQHLKEFVPSMSIIDVMMYNSVRDTNRLIDDFVFL